MKIFIAVASAAIFTLSTASPTVAQSASDARSVVLQNAEAGAVTPSADLDAGMVAPSITFAAETSKSEVALTLGDRRRYDWGFSQLSFNISTPIKKGEDEGRFFTDDDLAADTALSLDYSLTVTTAGERVATDDEMIALLQRARADCRARSTNGAGSSATIAACGELQYDDIRTALSSAEQDRFDDPFLTAPFFLAGAKATVAYDGVEYRELANPSSKTEDDRVPWSVTLRAGLIYPAQSFYLGAGLEYSQAFKDGKSRTLCTPASGSFQECFTGSYGAPTAEEEATIYGVVRMQEAFTLHLFGGSLPFALEVKPAYTFESDVAGVAASLYFVPDAKGNLTGGIRARFQTDDNDPDTRDENLSLGLFVGVAFSLLD